MDLGKLSRQTHSHLEGPKVYLRTIGPFCSNKKKLLKLFESVFFQLGFNYVGHCSYTSLVKCNY
jgi:hypothetical protein